MAHKKSSSIVMGNCNVAVGILINAKSEILIAQRALNLHQGGLWEFPGGKVEANEAIEDALKRELHEEIGILIQSSKFLMTIEHAYPNKHVQLHCYLVTQYSNEPKICDGQLDLQWVSLNSWSQEIYPLPEPNLKIIAALSLSKQIHLKRDIHS